MEESGKESSCVWFNGMQKSEMCTALRKGVKYVADQVVYAGKIKDLPSVTLQGHGGIEKRIVFGPERFWENYTARCFTLEGDAAVPLHQHDWPHYVFVLSGEGRVRVEDEEYPLAPLFWAHVPAGKPHAFERAGEEPLTFICIVPSEGDITSPAFSCSCGCDCGG